MSLYDKYILPKFLNCACGSKPITYQRKKVVPLAEGNVLEVGIGSGLNLPYYDHSKIDQIWGLDPSEELSLMAQETAQKEGLEINFISCGAEEIPLPNNHFDSVLITYTMCTIPEVIRANVEIKRVLKEGGKLIFRVASHDGEANNGLIIQDGDAEDEIDVVIANGGSSMTTVSGDFTVSGDTVLFGATYAMA